MTQKKREKNVQGRKNFEIIDYEEGGHQNNLINFTNNSRKESLFGLEPPKMSK